MKDHTTVIKLKGGMGNQMFQYAFGQALEEAAKQKGHIIELLYDITAYTEPNKKDTRRPYFLDLLNTNANTASDEAALATRNPYGIVSKVIRRTRERLNLGNPVAYDPQLLQPPYRHYYEGYWQSEKYFLPIAERIRYEFTLKDSLGITAQNAHNQIVLDPNSVSIFFRRTDYVGHPQFDIGEQEYQQRAIAKIQELVPDARLYVMSDDIEWVKENANLPAGSIFVSSDDIPPQEEMQLAAACRHNIIPNSTFAWWGAWLNQHPERIVIAPAQWARNDKGRHRDIIPETWVRV